MKKSAYFSKSNGTGRIFGLILWCLSALFCPVNNLSAQCSPDLTPPVCTAPPDMTLTSAEYDSLDINLLNFPDEFPKIYAAFGVATHWDNCDSSSSELQESFYLFAYPDGSPKKLQRRFFATDASGNTGEAVQFIWIGNPGGCSADQIPPAVVAPPDLTFTNVEYTALGIDLLNFPQDAQIQQAFGSAMYSDNCDSTANLDAQESYYLFENPDGSLKRVQRRFFVSDAAGNTGEAVQYIDIAYTYTLHVPAWRYPDDITTDSMTLVGGPNHALFDPFDVSFPGPCSGSYVKIRREWFFIDWVFAPGGTATDGILPALDINNDGIIGDPYDIILIGDSIWLYQNNVPTQRLLPRTTTLTYHQMLLNSRILQGIVHLDTLQNCALDAGEPGLADFKVKVIGQVSNNVYTAFADADGAFEVLVCTEDTLVEIGLDVPFGYGGSCASTYMVAVEVGPPVVQNIAVPLNSECQLLTVDIATWRLRPCFNSKYWVNYCNYSDQTVPDTYIDVVLDTFIQFMSSTLPGTLLSGNTYRFETGDLAPGECGQFEIDILLDCETPVGLTHCTEAFIYPADDCPPPSPWSGADLRVSGYCDGDSVRLQIKNVGSSAMAQMLDFIVTEDLIMAKSTPYQLIAGGTLTVSEPSNGATWRLETPQEPGHPWGGVVAAAVEGCGGMNAPGLVNIFPINDPDPFSSSDCTQNTSSYDPNDKQAFPIGYDNQHFIEPNTDIEYLIRFQNTGTDTAFNVVLLDTLSAYLNAQSVRPGASSHAYDFDVINGNVLRFRFDNILLPDSNVNEAASHGFVKFRIQQQPDNPLGTVINNSTAIYFDFNDPVITNTTWHTVGNNFVLVSTDTPNSSLGNLLVYPNPAAETVFFELPQVSTGGQFLLTDGLGNTVKTSVFSGKTFRFERGMLPQGLYFFNMTADSGQLFSGKIILK